jgi:hypothetical protein
MTIIKSIKTAINKTEYFKNKLKSKQPELFENVEIIGEYVKKDITFLVKTEYGICKITPNNLLKGHFPTIQTAVDKNEYFKNIAYKIHGELYDYSLVDYNNDKTKVKIISSEGIFEQTPNCHLSGGGCPILGKITTSKYHQENPSGWSYTNWEIAGNCSEHFESFKLYIIRCYSENELFYKIGKTYTTIKYRFKTKTNMPYNYEVIEVLVADAQTISNVEWNLKNKNKKYKYIPKLKFAGMNECFSAIFNFSLK